MGTVIDIKYFEELAEAESSHLCRNGRATYNDEEKSYTLTVWGDKYHFNLSETLGNIERRENEQSPVHSYFDIFAIYYLLRAGDERLTKEWISEKDVPGGVTFFRGPHLLPTELISSRFGNDIEAFKDCCRSFGGDALDMGDAAYSFSIMADLPVTVLYWLGDEDFPAEAKLLFDKSIIKLLSLDMIYALAVGVCARLGENRL